MLSPQYINQEESIFSSGSNSQMTWQEAPEREQNQQTNFFNVASLPNIEDINYNRNRIKDTFKRNLSLIINKPNEPESTLIESIDKLNSIDTISNKRVSLSAENLSKKLELELSYFQSDKIILNVNQYNNKYEVLETLGEGCIGLVKRIKHRITGEQFAVKMVATTEEEIIRNIVIEFNNLVQLSHENIVKMHELYIDYNDGFQSESRAFIIMDFIDGQEMFEVINDLGHYSEMHAKHLFKQLISAIDFLHRHGVCHRDLKPNNILCQKDSNIIKITDFNVSKFSENYKEYGNLQDCEKIDMWTYTGTVAFSAPEIFTGGGYTQMVDMWSAGCILYSMLSGSLPFNSIYLNDLVEDIKRGEFLFPEAQFASISGEAKDLISKLLQIEPTERLNPDCALLHPWFNEVERHDTLCNLTIKDHLHQLTSKHSPRKRFIANQMSGALNLRIYYSHSDNTTRVRTQIQTQKGYLKQFRFVSSDNNLPSPQKH